MIIFWLFVLGVVVTVLLTVMPQIGNRPWRRKPQRPVQDLSRNRLKTHLRDRNRGRWN